MNIHNYLSRFKATGKKPSYENLADLQLKHLYHIPFENLDVIRKEPIYLNVETMYEKIVRHHRGGYCYELNGLLQFFLSKLNYDAYLVSATVLRPNNTWAKADTHAAIIVHLDQPYLVDVGFGAQTPRVPIPLNSQKKTAIKELYQVRRNSDETYDLIRTFQDESRILYRFTLERKQLIDFHEGCIFNQVSKNSTFTHTDIVALATKNGRVTLRDHTFTTEIDGVKESKQLSPEEKNEVLQTVFSLRLNG